jgi:hypothetical protein
VIRGRSDAERLVRLPVAVDSRGTDARHGRIGLCCRPGRRDGRLPEPWGEGARRERFSCHMS